MKLLHKISLAIFILAIAIAITFALVIYFLTLSSLKDAISIQQVEVATQTMDKIDRLLYERLNNIIAISEDEEFEGFLVGKDLDVPKEKAESITKLKEMSLVTGPWDTLSLVDTKGEIVLSANGDNIGDNVKEELGKDKNFESVFKGDMYYSDLFLDSKTGKPSIVFASPIRNEDDPKQPVIGAAVGYLSWPIVLEILQSAKNRHVKLFNKNGKEIGDNHSEHMSEILNNDYIANSAVKKALSGVSGSEVLKGTDEDDRENQLISYVPQKGFLINKGNGWGLLIETPVSVAFNDAKRNALDLIFIIIPVVFLAALIILFILKKTLISPVVNLTKITQDITQGDFSKKAEVTSKDEISLLGASFNEMTAKLGGYQQGLEKEVEERTKELVASQQVQAKQLKEAEQMNNLMVGRELKMIELKKQLAELKKRS